jgi:hypothetical protein
VQRGIWVRTQHLLWDQGKPRKTLIVLAGRRTFRMQLASSQQSSIKSANPNTWESLATALPVLTLALNGGVWSISCPRHFSTGGTAIGTHCMGPRASLHAMKSRRISWPCQELNTDSSAIQHIRFINVTTVRNYSTVEY